MGTASRGRPPAGGRRAAGGEGLRADAALHRLRALAHPLRQRLLALFAHERMTTKQAALRLGETPTKLYHHVAALERAGLVVLRETRPNRGTVEKYYEAVTHSVPAGREDVASPAVRQAIGATVFEQARQDFFAALEPGSGLDPPPAAVRLLARLAPDQARALRREILALVGRFRAMAKRGERGGARRRRTYAFTASFAPVAGDEPG